MKTRDESEHSFSFLGYGLLLFFSIILLVIGFAPIGLLLILKEFGLDLSFLNDSGGVPFFVFSLIVISIILFPRFPQGTKVAIWGILGLGVLNLGGCMAFNGLKDIGKIKLENKRVVATGYSARVFEGQLASMEAIWYSKVSRCQVSGTTP